MLKINKRIVGAFWLAAAAAITSAQSKITLEFGDEATREIWFSKAMPTEKPATTETSAAKVDIPMEMAKPGDKVFVWNRSTGNLAYKVVKDIITGWKVADTEYKWIGMVKVQVLSGGKPVSAASIKLVDAKRSQTQVIDTATNGVAEFYGVYPGQIKVETTYRLSGKTGAPNKVSSELNLKRDSPDPTIAVALPDGVETIAPKEEPKKSDEPKEAKPGQAKVVVTKPNRVVGAVISLLFVAAAVVGIYFLILWMRRNEDDVKKRLAKLGVQVPEPPDPADATPPPAVPVAPQPQAKIILDDSAPMPSSTSPTAAVAAPYSPTPALPRLVADNGTVFNLAEGASAVGREGAVEILLPGEGSVSRRHAEVVRQGSMITVKDLGSTNGTFVNGVKINGETPLSVGDTVQFGMVRLRFEG